MAVKIVVYHGSYGCDTGCCAHIIELHEDGVEKSRYTDLMGHPDSEEEAIEYAKGLVIEHFGEEHVKDLDWDNCKVVTWSQCI